MLFPILFLYFLGGGLSGRFGQNFVVWLETGLFYNNRFFISKSEIFSFQRGDRVVLADIFNSILRTILHV